MSKKNKYISTNIPPPFCPTMYGNFHTFPIPIAQPALNSIKPSLLPKLSLSLFSPVIRMFSVFLLFPVFTQINSRVSNIRYHHISQNSPPFWKTGKTGSLAVICNIPRLSAPAVHLIRKRYARRTQARVHEIKTLKP